MVSFLDQSIAIYAKKHAVVVNLNETIGYTFQFMIKYNIRHISIINEQYKLVGVLTAEDILRTLIHSENAKFLQLKNHEVMSTDVQFVEDSQTLRDTIILMDKTDVTAMPVLVDGAYDGIFTDKDILQMDRIWRTIPDSSVTSYRGIGRKIFPEDIISKDFTLWEAATHILRNNSRFILIKDEDERFSGMVSVNNVLVSDPRIPFGGIKNSGVGRELSYYGLKEFVNVKSVIMN
ncbi:MAG: aldehyde dehydrogenase family protein [Candidatus Heimdallarchaeota archaeon]|nr:aldehyde dehydrogenase family protein [Candidatus Heimdallarchaeota archaeon]